MEVIAKMPTSLKERLEFGTTLRIPATFNEFLDLLEECEYRIEYDNGEIISFMGYGTENHEKLVMKIGHLLLLILNEGLYSVYGSNLALHIPGFEQQHYNADCAVVKGKSEKVALRGNMKATTNPILLVEVLSDSTQNFDLNQKFFNYRKIPSLQQLLYLESTEMLALSYTRHNSHNEWLLREFSLPSDKIPILDKGFLSLEDIYRTIDFKVQD